MKALIIIDMQNDFMDGGPLSVSGAREVIPVINALMDEFSLVVATQDWHPKDHISFAKNHPDTGVGDVIETGGVKQTLWPVHCVQNTQGADFAFGLHRDKISNVFKKGADASVDSYSAFFDNAKRHSTGLDTFLRGAGVDELHLAGVATDVCVYFSAEDALDLGYKVFVRKEGCRGIDPVHSKERLADLQKRGAVVI